MKFLKLLLPFLLIFIFCAIIKSFSQVSVFKPLEIEKSAVVRKIVWVDDAKFCVVSDRMTQAGFLHFITVFDTTGKIIRPLEKIYTKYSVQHEYFLVLGKSLFFFDHLTNEYGEEKFKLMGTVYENGVLNENEIYIFNIRGTTERKILNEKRYNFKVYRGISNRKALLTYNNDYQGEIKEGFRYRMIDETGKLSDEQKLELPYADRLSNIEDVVYDDETDKVYLIGDLFKLMNKNNRTFENSFAARYDLKNNKYDELISGIPAFRDNKIQHMVDSANILFSGLGLSEDRTDGWTASFLSIDKNTFQVADHYYYALNTDTIKRFFGRNNQLLSEFILPLSFMQDKNGNLTVGWNFFYELDFNANASKERKTVIALASVAFGVVGAVIAVAATSDDHVNNYRKSLWLNYSPGEKKIKEHLLSSDFHAKEYYLHSFASLQRNDTCWALMNSFPPDQKYHSIICARTINLDSQTCDASFSTLFSKGELNYIYPGSLFYHKKTYYLLGEYDPANDPNRDKYRLDYATFLIQIRE